VKNKNGIRSMQVYIQTQRTVVGLQLFNGTGEKFLRQNPLGYVMHVFDSSDSVRCRLRTHPDFANGEDDDPFNKKIFSTTKGTIVTIG
jgi:hypothetical protein